MKDDLKQIKITKLTELFEDVMHTLELDLKDDSLRDTPKRIAKMYVNELFSGLDEQNKPTITTQLNKFHYDQMLIENNIYVKSVCEHHFVPFLGYAHIAYIPRERVVGLSKLNRVVEYFSRRPQVQERLTHNVLNFLKEKLDTNDLAVVIDACHLCVRLRGVQHERTVTRTTALSGAFKETSSTRSELFNSIPSITGFAL